MEYPLLTKSHLAQFSGRALAAYSDFADQAISQARLLFKIATGLTEFPDNEDQAELATLGILSMADSIILSQPYQEAAASPFSSETIGSYTYTKASRAVAAGQQTGVMWFDMAVSELSVRGDDGHWGGGFSIEDGSVIRDAETIYTWEDVQSSTTGYGYDGGQQ